MDLKASKTDFCFFIINNFSSFRSYIEAYPKATKNNYQNIVFSETEFLSGIHNICIDGTASIYDIKHYGRLLGLEWIWKNVNCPYIGFSLSEDIPILSYEDITQELLNYPIITVKYRLTDDTLKNEYRRKFYGYDLKILRQCLNNFKKEYFEFSEKELLNTKKYMPPVIIMRKDIFRKFCLFLFEVLNDCSQYIYEKKSKYQNTYMEHLAYVLLMLYIEYNKKKYKTSNILELANTSIIKQNEEINPSDSLIKRVNDLIQAGDIEYAEQLCIHNENHSENPIQMKLFEKYHRQHFHFPVTDIDSISNISELLYKDSYYESNNYPGLFIMWNAVNTSDYLDGLRELGISIETMDGGSLYSLHHEECLDRMLEFLNNKHFSFIFTINYFDFVSEACYIHGIPYIAWAYDSPVTIEDKKCAPRDTTYVFLFDSDEVELHRKKGTCNVYYMPLAINPAKYDSIICSKEDHKKYDAQISFVGRLYENRLNEYLNYLSDYKKGLLNAVIDYNTGLYDSYGVEDAFASIGLDDKEDKTFINAVLKGEGSDELSPIRTKDEVFSRVALLAQKTITNRERLILISILSNHWEFKLYSTSSHEVFRSTIECGTVDYDTQMPKVFKCSNINLNVTLKSIKTGIPLRCLDIMGCGGFLLSSYQRDFDYDFKDGHNIALFKSPEEAYDKCKYYLSHDSTRIKIATRAYDTVRSNYTYKSHLNCKSKCNPFDSYTFHCNR